MSAPPMAGSAVCALASSVVPMIVGRGLQGRGMVPLGIALLRDVVPEERLSCSIALVSASMGGRRRAGPAALRGGRAVSEWRVLFWGSADVIAVLVWFLVPTVPAVAKGRRFDAAGAVGLGAGLVCLLLAVSQGAEWGWGPATAPGLFAAAALVLPAWAAWELRIADPPGGSAHDRPAARTATNLAPVFVGSAMDASMLLMPQLVRLGRHARHHADQQRLGLALLAAAVSVRGTELMMRAGIGPYAARVPAGDTAGIFASPMGRA